MAGIHDKYQNDLISIKWKCNFEAYGRLSWLARLRAFCHLAILTGHSSFMAEKMALDYDFFLYIHFIWHH